MVHELSDWDKMWWCRMWGCTDLVWEANWILLAISSSEANMQFCTNCEGMNRPSLFTLQIRVPMVILRYQHTCMSLVVMVGGIGYCSLLHGQGECTYERLHSLFKICTNQRYIFHRNISGSLSEWNHTGTISIGSVSLGYFGWLFFKFLGYSRYFFF